MRRTATNRLSAQRLVRLMARTEARGDELLLRERCATVEHGDPRHYGHAPQPRAQAGAAAAASRATARVYAGRATIRLTYSSMTGDLGSSGLCANCANMVP
jgi:hypothetical protein